MTRPRSYQLNDPNERFTRIPFKSTPAVGSYSTTFTGSDYNAIVNASSTGSGPTGSVTGSSHDLPASIVGTGCEYPSGIALTPGNQFTVVVNGTPTLITLQVSDFSSLNKTSVSRLVNRINLTTGKQIASRVDVVGGDGALKLTSDTTGSASSIQLLPSGPSGLSVLQAMGFGPSVIATASGSHASRGIITKSLDGLGGKLYLNKADGYSLTASSLIYYRLPKVDVDLNGIQYTQNVVPGARIYARLTTDQTIPSFVASFKSKVLRYVKAVSRQNNFSAITGSPGVDVIINDLNSNAPGAAFRVTLPNAPTSVSQVVDAFNSAWASYTGNNMGKIISRNLGPFYPSGSIRTMDIEVDGVIKPTVTISDDMVTAAQIGAAINAQTATTIASVNSRGQLIISSPTTGPSSSVGINSIDPFLSKQLGIVRGLYKGYNICVQNGCEIEFVLPFPSASLELRCDVPGILDIIGFSNSNYPQVLGVGLALESMEFDTPFPWYSDVGELNSANYIVGMWPEYEELGDVPNDQFANEREVDFDSEFKHSLPNPFTDTAKSGLSVVSNDLGLIDSNTSAYSLSSGRIGSITLPPYTLGNPKIYADQNDDLIYKLTNLINVNGTSTIRMGVDQGPLGPGAVISSNLSPTSSGSGQSFYKLDNSARNSSAVEIAPDEVDIKFKQASSSPWIPSTWESSVRIGTSSGISGIAYEVGVRDDTAIRGINSELKLSDQNISNAANLKKYVSLSGTVAGNQGDAQLRIANKPIAAGSTHNVVRSLNARHTIVCGDGINTFGDFNGATAIADAAAFLTANSVVNATVIIKSGTYAYSSTITFSNENVNIIGEEVSINAPVSGPTFAFINPNATSATRKISLKGLTFERSNSNYSVKFQNVIVDVENCVFKSGMLINPCGFSNLTESSYSVAVHRSIFYASDYDEFSCLNISNLDWSTTIPSMQFNQCYFDSVINGSSDRKIFNLGGRTIGASQFSSIEFNQCDFNLTSHTDNNPFSGVINPTKNTGLIDLKPQNDGRTVSGLSIDNVVFDTCNIKATNTLNNIVLHLSCDTASNTPTTTSNFGIINRFKFINNNINVLCNNSLSPIVVGSGVGSFEFIDNTVNISTLSSKYGELPYWFTKYDLGNTLDSYSSQGLCSFGNAKGYVVNNTINNAFEKSGKNIGSGAELLVAYGQSFTLKAFFINYNLNTSGTSIPNSRISIFDVKVAGSPLYQKNGTGEIFKNQNCFIDGLSINGLDTSNQLTWVNRSFVYCKGSNITIINSDISNLPGLQKSDRKGIIIDPSLAGDSLQNVTIDSCNISGYVIGVCLDLYTDTIDNVKIINNRISATQSTSGTQKSQGVYFRCFKYLKGANINISNNTVYVKSSLFSGSAPAKPADLPSAPTGILISSLYDADNPNNSMQTSIKVQSNSIKVSDSTNSANSYKLPGIIAAPCYAQTDHTTDHVLQGAIITDNHVIATNDTNPLGYILITSTDSVPVGGVLYYKVAPPAYDGAYGSTYSTFNLKGAQTYELRDTSTRFGYVNGAYMMYNQAKLFNTNTLTG